MADVGRGSRGLRTALWASGFEDGVENGGAGVCDDDIWGRCRERPTPGQQMAPWVPGAGATDGGMNVG